MAPGKPITNFLKVNHLGLNKNPERGFRYNLQNPKDQFPATSLNPQHRLKGGSNFNFMSSRERDQENPGLTFLQLKTRGLNN